MYVYYVRALMCSLTNCSFTVSWNGNNNVYVISLILKITNTLLEISLSYKHIQNILETHPYANFNAIIFQASLIVVRFYR